MVAVTAVGSVIVTELILEQPNESVTVTDQIPAVSPVAVLVTWAGAGLFHK
jgi:hypothetical protein